MKDTNLILAAASAATSAATDLIETARNDESGDVAVSLRAREAAENLADALQTVLSYRLAGDTDYPERDADARLLDAVRPFLAGWA